MHPWDSGDSQVFIEILGNRETKQQYAPSRCLSAHLPALNKRNGKEINIGERYSGSAASRVTQWLKQKIRLPVQETQVPSLGWEDSPGGGHGSPLQCSCLENPTDGGAWWGYSPWGRTESDTTEQRTQTYSYTLTV